MLVLLVVYFAGLYLGTRPKEPKKEAQEALTDAARWEDFYNRL